MTVEIRVPTLGESITEATVAKWLKQPGDRVARDEPVVELETDKVTLEVPAPQAGVIGAIQAEEGSNVPVEAVLGTIADEAAASGPHPPVAVAAGPTSPAMRDREVTTVRAEPLSGNEEEGGMQRGPGEDIRTVLDRSGPAVRKLVAESGVDVAALTPSGPGGRLTKADVIAAPQAPALRQLPTPPPEVEAPATSARERPPAEREPACV